MKRILLEMEKLKNPHSGLGQVCYHLGVEFHQLAHETLEFDYYLPESQNKIFGQNTKTVHHSSLHKLFRLNSKPYQIWHCLHQDSAYLPSNKNTKLLLTIHDLNFLEKYSGIRRALKLKKLQTKVNRASAITVISNFTKKMVEEHLETENKKIHVISNGNTLQLIQNPKKPSFIDKMSGDHEFIFSLGIISKKKNFHVLLPLLEKNKNLHLIIAGNTDSVYSNELIQLAKKSTVADRLHLPGVVDQEQKNWLYQNCKAFVFPSLTEGFGLPVIEAMSVGKPVFLSNLTSLPEIGGPDAFYWNTFEGEELNLVFETGLKSFDQAHSLRNQKWASQFSWKSAAHAYLQLYQQL